MAANNYNELAHSTASTADCDNLDPLYRYDTHFPERLSRLHLGNEDIGATTAGSGRKRRQRARTSARFKTQPITFDEIKEVDEEPTDTDLMRQFTAFSRSMDGLIPGFQQTGATSKHHSKSPSPSADACPADPDDVTTDGTSDPAGASYSNDDSIACVVPGLTQLPRLEASRSRRSKRRVRKGIEEEPEQEAAASQDAA